MAEGQYTGKKGKYVYTADDNRQYILTLDNTLVLASSGLTVFDPTTAEAAQNKPLKFKPRGVHWQGILDTRTVRKFLICAAGGTSPYASTQPVAVTIDGVEGFTTGRRGETLSY